MLKKFISAILVIAIISTGCGRIKEEEKAASDVPTYAPKEEISEFIESEMSADKPYADNRRTISFYGLKEYDKFSNGKIEDKPKNGNKYLVLYLQIKNTDKEQFYFHESYLETKVDGKDIRHTAIFNDPEDGFITAFSNIPSGYTLYGYIVWEVPKNWKKLDLKYTALEQAEGISLQMHFTKNDLEDPADITHLQIENGLEYSMQQ